MSPIPCRMSEMLPVCRSCLRRLWGSILRPLPESGAFVWHRSQHPQRRHENPLLLLQLHHLLTNLLISLMEGMAVANVLYDVCEREREATGDGQESGVKRRSGGGQEDVGEGYMTDRETDALTYRRRKFKVQGRLSLMWYLICKWTWCHNRRIWMAWAWGCEEHRLAPPVAGVVRPPSSRPWAYPNASWPCAKPGFLHKHAKLVPQTLPSIRIRYASKTLLPSSLSRHCRLPLVNISFFRLVELSDTWLEVIHHLVFSDATAKKTREWTVRVRLSGWFAFIRIILQPWTNWRNRYLLSVVLSTRM